MGRQSIRLFSCFALAIAVTVGSRGQDLAKVHREAEAKWAAETGLPLSAVHELWRLASHYADSDDDDSQIESLDTQALASRRHILLVTSAGENSCLTLTVFLATTPYHKIWSEQQTPEGHDWCGPAAKVTVNHGEIDISMPEEGDPESSGPQTVTVDAWGWNGTTYQYAGTRRFNQFSVGNPPRTLPLSSFQLPEKVTSLLETSGCSVAQTDLVPSPNNVVKGEFAKRGQQDWLVLCWNGYQNVPLIVWGGNLSCDSPFARDLGRFVKTDQLKATIVPELEAAPEVKDPRMEGDHQWIRIRWSPFTTLFYSCDDGRWTKHSGERCKTEKHAITASTTAVQEASATQQNDNQLWRSDPVAVARAELRRILGSIVPPFVLPVLGDEVKCEEALSIKQLCYYWDKSSGISASVGVERLAPGAWFATETSVTTCSQ